MLICTKCNKEYGINEKIWCCECGGLLDIVFKPVINPGKIKGLEPTIWRYREALPIEDDKNIVSLGEGFTPLVKVRFGDKTVLIKQDQLCPSGSFKDRGAAVMISKIKELGIDKVVEDSSGNAGSAVAAYSAAAGIKAEIYVPASSSAGKLAQIKLYGADLMPVPGTREDAAEAAMRAAQNDYYASHSWNPFFFQGTKTFAYEVVEQLGWKAPDTVVLPVGNGALILGAYIGFKEMLDAGIIDKPPKLVGIQTEACSPLADAFEAGKTEPVKIDKKESAAEGMAVAEPARGTQILDAVRRFNGQFIKVDEGGIIEALRDMLKIGFYIEPTAAATIAGVKKYLMYADYNETVVTTITGHGLKASEKILRLMGN